MQALQQRRRRFHWRGPDIRQLGPACLVVWLDERLILGKGQFDPGVGVEVAIGKVMDDLTYSPALGAIWCVQLLGREPCNRRAQCAGGCRDLPDPVFPEPGIGLAVELEGAYGVPKVFHYSSPASATREPGGFRGAPSGVSPRNSKCFSLRTRSWSGVAEISSKRSRAKTTSATRAAGSHWPGVNVGYRSANSGRKRASRIHDPTFAPHRTPYLVHTDPQGGFVT